MTMSEDRVEVLYEQVCSQHDGIADFRAKLLALLPIASGAGIFLLFEKGGIPPALSPHLVAIGLFGIAVTTGLFFYELRGIQKCNALIEAAIELEQELSHEFQGAFRWKPSGTWGVGATTAALIIYPAVAGAWAYMATLGSASLRANPVTCALISTAVAAVWALTARRVLKGGARAQDLGKVRD